jgi:hypothetical protein
MSFDSTVPLPDGATVASRATPSSMPPVAPGRVLSFSLPLLAVLHHVRDMTSRHAAPTLPPPSFPHAGIFASSEEASWCRSSSVPGQTTSRDPRSCLLRTGCIRNNVPAEPLCRYHTPPHFGSRVSATFPCSLSRSINAGSFRQQRHQVWSVNRSVATSRRTFVPGLPTLTSATRERRPGRPYTVVHV